MEKPKVSVVIPVFNGEKTLKQCLNSVLNQTFQNYEIIVVDNNSTDNSKNIIKDFQRKNNKVKYVFEPLVSRGAARNRGEKKAEGEIIVMTDCDCIVPRNWITELIKPILKDNKVSVQGNKRAVIKNYWTDCIEEEKRRITKQRLEDKKIGLLDTANFAIKKGDLKKIGFSDPFMKNCNDTELQVRLKANKYSLFFKKIQISHYEPDSWLKVFLKFFDRGKWNQKLREKHKDKKDFFSNWGIMFYLRFLAGLIFKLITINKFFFYDLISGTGWRAGVIWEKLRNIFQKSIL